MSSSPTTRNRLVLQGTGDNAETWGEVLNDGALQLLDDSLDGITVVSIAANRTLVANNYAPDEARSRVLKFTGPGGFAVTIPGVQKVYNVHNTCVAAVPVKTAGGAAVLVPAGALSFLYCDAVNCYLATATGSSTFVTPVIAPAATTLATSLRLPPGVAPNAPQNGDMWTTSADGLQYRVAGQTLGPAWERIVPPTAVAAVSVIDVALVGAWRRYEFAIDKFQPDTPLATVGLRVSIDNGATYKSGAADYQYSFLSAASGGWGGSGGNPAANMIFLANDLARGASNPPGTASFTLTISEPHNGTYYKPIYLDRVTVDRLTEDIVRAIGSGRYFGGTNEITHLRLLVTDGTMSCTYSMNGMR